MWPNLQPYNTRKLQFRSKRCVFIGYSNQHKGFKCLDPSEGRVYISRDAVFDEKVFPFASLLPNARARLRAELQLLSEILLNSSSCIGDAQIHNQHLNSFMPTNVVSSSCDPVQSTEKNLASNDVDCRDQLEGNRPYFMCHTQGRRTCPGVDPPASASGSDPLPPSGSARQQAAVLLSVQASAQVSASSTPASSSGGSSVASSPPPVTTIRSVAAQMDPIVGAPLVARG